MPMACNAEYEDMTVAVFVRCRFLTPMACKTKDMIVAVFVLARAGASRSPLKGCTHGTWSRCLELLRGSLAPHADMQSSSSSYQALFL